MARLPPPPSSWRIIPRPLLETILNNHAHHHRVPQPMLLHGPRGAGKSSLIHSRLLPSWNSGPHLTAYVDLLQSKPSTWSSLPSSSLSFPPLKNLLESSLETLTTRAIRLGAISSRNVFEILTKYHSLRRLARKPEPESRIWNRAVFDRAGSLRNSEEGLLPSSPEEAGFVKEAAAALEVAREVIAMEKEWRREAVRWMNATGKFSRSLANSSTDWVMLLVELLSEAAEVGFFQPKLVINNIEVLRKATTTDDSTVPAGMYHDSLIWRLLALGVNERCMPVILVTSDSYYSNQAFYDFGFQHAFLSRETFGWTVQEAKLHMVSDFFTEREWKVIDEVLGPNPRHLSELYALKQSNQYQEIMQLKSSFEDIVDAYLAYLQVTVVNPAMEAALTMLQKFASDVHNGKIPEDRLHFGAPWRHPPSTDDPATSLKWAKIQLIDFVQSFANTEFGVNYLADYSLEILDDPSAIAMMEVGLLYAQRDPSFIRPITRGIQRCLARWLVQERMQMSLRDSVPYFCQRIIRGRSYRHLMKEVGYK